MLFMNEWEIAEKRAQHAKHPALGPATQFLYEFMQEVNSHSDGWPYWSLPVKAAKNLIALIQRGNATIDEVQVALRPIKSFMTRRGYKAGMSMPALQLVLR
jgi:hypothetical protein